jgi:hypothetical protein
MSRSAHLYRGDDLAELVAAVQARAGELVALSNSDAVRVALAMAAQAEPDELARAWEELRAEAARGPR